MKKLFVALAFALCLSALVSALTACGNGEDEGEAEGCLHIWDTEPTVEIAATCKKEGVSVVRCTACGEEKPNSERVIPKALHNYVINKYIEPSCVAIGYEEKTCRVCGNFVAANIPPTDEHTWSQSYTTEIEPTCTTEGLRSIKCIRCSEAVKPGSVEIVPINHAWSDLPTVDVEPTCTEPGSTSIRCVSCLATKDGSEKIIPAPGHTGLHITVQPTFFSEGYGEGDCSTCGITYSGPVHKTEVSLNAITTTDKLNSPNLTGRIGDALGDKHLYPTDDDPDGNDLYLEYSLLWNSTMSNVRGNNISVGHIAREEDVIYESSAIVKYFSRLYYKSDTTWCPFVGGFELSDTTSFTYGPEWKKNSKSEEDFVIIDGHDGWHRIGIKYHQNVYEDNGSFTYDVTVTIYIDGVKVSESVMPWGALFYSARLVEGKGFYTQSSSIASYYALFYRIGNGAVSTAGTTAYFPVADCYLTVGDGFLLDVDPVADPEARDFAANEGVTLSGKIYYELADEN